MVSALRISIPSASNITPAQGKSYTQYHVTLQLPLKKHSVQRRYSDFVALHAELCTHVGAAPPARLPAKSWLRRTVNNEALTEERRKGLEAYLQSVLETDDARWRSSAAWRSFLSLPGAQDPNGDDRKAALQSPGLAQDPNGWLDRHRDLKSQIQSARQQLKQREAAATAQQQHALSADAKATLVRAATSVAQLEDGLSSIAKASKGDDAVWGGSKKLGDGELRRRTDLIAAAKKEIEGLEGLLRSLATRSVKSSGNDMAVASEGDKAALWSGTASARPGGRVLGAPLKETERTRELDNTGVLQLQQQIMKEQDEDVLSLGKTVAKLKDMGIMINEELEIQNEMLGLVEQDADRLQGKVDVARNRIKKIR